MEASSDYGEEAEPNDLDGHTGQGNVFSTVQLVDGVGVGRGRAGDHDGADELEDQGDDIAADEDGSDPAGCGSVSVYPN